MILDDFIFSVLLERSRYQQETGEIFSVALQKQIKKYVTTRHPVKYAFTMINLPKVGINPATNYSTPAGVYFYPLTPTYYKKLIDNDLPFMTDAKYVGLVRLRDINDESKWLKFLERGQSGKGEGAVSDAYMLAAKMYPGIWSRETADVLDISRDGWGSHRKFRSYDAHIFDIGYAVSQAAQMFSERETWAWTKFFRKLGYSGIYDAGFGIVHENEPTQVVCLDPSAYEVVEIFDTKELRRVVPSTGGDIKSYVQSLSRMKKLQLAQGTKSEQVLLAILEDQDNKWPATKAAAADNLNITQNLLWKILRREIQMPDKIYIVVSVYAAANPRLTMEMMQYIVDNEQNFPHVLFAAAYNQEKFVTWPIEIREKIVSIDRYRLRNGEIDAFRNVEKFYLS